ncbi:hypothetical protein C1H76_1189 [Elsinoe australis]|uniref:ATP synthase subunit K, mitochondrial n=1 Tax=Elsinoe australis TaxID=40998 RepID=A0A2P7YDR5_9PEZI|nr:hypothetical protein B9Z65_8438 [Elsinoe australis]TKX26657.1 hypothetical protein C1H76_1189 [Elsinoe australis]
MVVKYDLLGRKVGSHHLAIAVLGTLFGGVYIGTRGGGKKATQAPPIQAQSKDEENFIQDFLKEAEAKEAKH